MNKSGDSSNSESENPTKNKPKNRGKKRKRFPSDSSENEGILPDNTLEMEKKVHDSAVKNNLDDTSVRKILKTVVTNDHVLALVKLQEEAENAGPEENSLRPKLTRAKVKELKKVSPQTPAWNLDNLELTPIKHIPVKTRPEVKALIAQELPDDEDDEEYQPTNDDVPSDDDQGLESCSDVDSQPRTPATPRSQHTVSPRVVKDGPFKVPQDVSTPTRRKLDLEEDATIALRTRSKLSLSATSIEHIESTFVPPDEVPPAVDDIWNEFLTECLNPASVTRTEEDDETDPEYNVAADPDANDEDEESLGNSLIKISKKELNDLMTELLSIMPTTADDELMTNSFDNSVLTDNSHTEGNSTRWDGKVEPVSDEERRPNISDRITFEKKGYSRLLSVGKREPEDTHNIVQDSETNIQDIRGNVGNSRGKQWSPRLKVDVRSSAGVLRGKEETVRGSKESVRDQEENLRRSDRNVRTEDNGKDSVVTKKSISKKDKTQKTERTGPTRVSMEIEEINESVPSGVKSAPPLLRRHLRPSPRDCVLINVEPTACVLPEQLKILQQQLRQHIQLASSNYLQLYVHPLHWSHAPPYKEYLESLLKLGEDNPNSVVNVCNLRPAVQLIRNWESDLSESTPENTVLIKFMQAQIERSRRGGFHKHYHGGAFHEKFMRTVSDSPVFLYPHLLPPMPYRADQTRRFAYMRAEDELIALGLDQFWQYVENNPQIYKPRQVLHARHRWGVSVTLQLVCKYMFPWLAPKILLGHIQHMKKVGDKDNPIVKFFKSREVTPVEHRLLPFDPQMTLYDHSEHEMPKLWVRFLGQSSQRFRQHIYRRSITLKNQDPIGVPIYITPPIQEPPKNPLHTDFTKEIPSNRQNLIIHDEPPQPLQPPQPPQSTQPPQPTQPPQIMYKLVETSTGAVLMPLSTITVDSNTKPIATAQIITSESSKDANIKSITVNELHCTCCLLLRKICKRQTLIEEYFGKNPRKLCDCKRMSYPKITNRLKLLASQFRSNYIYSLEVIKGKLEILKNRSLKKCDDDVFSSIDNNNLDDLVAVTQFHSRLLTKMLVVRDTGLKKKVHTALSRFKPGTDEPETLAKKMFEACGVELVDIYKEFLGFLTPLQADRAGMFKDHFLSNMMGLVEKVEAQVKDLPAKKKILERLKEVYTTNLATSCDICTNILSTLHKYPDLARHVFSLFPHTKKSNTPKPASNSHPQLTILLTQPIETIQVTGDQTEQGDTNLPVNVPSEPAAPTIVPSETDVPTIVPSETVVPTIVPSETTVPAVVPSETTVPTIVPCETTVPAVVPSETEPSDVKQDDSMLDDTHATMDYEADHSTNNAEDSDDGDSTENGDGNAQNFDIKMEHSPADYTETEQNHFDPVITVSKTEIQEYEHSNHSLVVVFDDEDDSIKPEAPEWSRDEDKVILELLKEHLITPEQRQDKTLSEIVEEKSLIDLTAQSLTEKSIEDIRKRIMYLLQLLVFK